MELICKGTYHSALCSLYEGDSTNNFNIPEDVLKQMLNDHPTLFEEVGKQTAIPANKSAQVAPAAKVEEEGKEEQIEKQSEKVEIETQESKAKMRKK